MFNNNSLEINDELLFIYLIFDKIIYQNYFISLFIKLAINANIK